jgi:peptidoglycan/xylan/chitin deacetylase (PgdA/CDA1 family)
MIVLYGVLAAIAFLLFSARYTWWLQPKPWGKGWPRVLMYHHISPTALASGMNTPPERFERHLKWLQAQGAIFCTLSELAVKMNNKEEGRFVALTFDDGFADNYQFAYPILKKHGARMTVFVAPDCPGIEGLSPEAIREMQQDGRTEFGAHTLTHVNLTTLDDASAAQEIAASAAAVEKLSGAPCRSFAYPFGRFEEKHQRMVEEAGMPLAVSTKKRILNWDNINPLAIPRISINGEMNRLQFHLALTRGKYRV